jgi:hypothetical protein
MYSLRMPISQEKNHFSIPILTGVKISELIGDGDLLELPQDLQRLMPRPSLDARLVCPEPDHP